MKKQFFLLIVAVLFTGAAFAQKVEIETVPSAVQSAFQQAFPGAEDAEWKMKNADFMVKFEHQKSDWKAKYDLNGNLLKTSQEIKKSELPEKIREQIKVEFPKAKIDDVEKHTKKDKKVVYEVKLEIKKKDFKVFYAEDGNRIKKDGKGCCKKHKCKSKSKCKKN